MTRVTTSPPAMPSLRIAAIDIGSNSVHMIVAQIDADGGVTTLWRVKEMVALGRISFPHKQLPAEAMDRVVASLGRMKQAAQQREAEHIVAVATSAIREAANGGELVQRIKDELKLKVKVVSARDEAKLIYLGVRGAMDLGKKPHLMIDIGGGSVEFIVGDEGEAKFLESRKLGAARMTAQFVKSDPIGKDDLQALRDHYAAEITPMLPRINALRPADCLGTSGTLENIAALCGGTYGGKPVIELDKLEKLEAKLIKSTTADRSQLRGIDDQRKDQIIAGVVLVVTFMKLLKLGRISLCHAALREGILAEYLSRHAPDLQIRREVPDPRRRSILDLARRHHSLDAHGQQVSKLALRLFDDLKPLHGLGDRERELIDYGALLHDVGRSIGDEDHHKHSDYLIRHGRLTHFNAHEIDVVALLARYHRKETPSGEKKRYKKLHTHDRRTIDVGTALIRIADALDRTHGGAIQELHCRIEKKHVEVVLKHAVDVQLEMWAAKKKRGWFEETLDRKIEFVSAK
jgi:exopolyphosphatase / guanosine-5'-triphosphate,3'-diphosphate pyrophosphatase